MQLPLTALTALENLINPALRQLAATGGLTATHLQELEGSVFELRATPPGLQVFLQVTPEGLCFHRYLEDPADAWIEAPPGVYLKMATSSTASSLLFSPAVQVGGATAKLESLQDLIAGLGLDAGELVARFAGPLPLASFRAGLDRLLSWGHRAGSAAGQDLKDYLEDESGFLPSRNSLHLLEDDLETLRLDVDRLTARVQLLEAAANKAAGENQ